MNGQDAWLNAGALHMHHAFNTNSSKVKGCIACQRGSSPPFMFEKRRMDAERYIRVLIGTVRCGRESLRGLSLPDQIKWVSNSLVLRRKRKFSL